MMIDRNARNFGYGSQLAIFLGLTAGGIMISLILSSLIILIMAGGNIPSDPAEMLQPKYYNVLMVLQAVATFFIFFAPAWFFAAICYRKPAKFLGFNMNINIRQFFVVIGIIIFTFPLSGLLGELNKAIPIPQSWAAYFKNLELAREAQEAALIQINTFSRYLVSLLIIALLPALFEEIYFRAAIQNLLTRWFKSPWTAILVTSLVFSAIHASYYGFLVRFGLGVILGSVFYYSYNLWLSVLIHFLFNGIQVTVLYQMNMHSVKQAKDIEQNFPLWTGVVALLILIYLFKAFKKVSPSGQDNYPAEELRQGKLPGDDFEKWLNQS